MFTFWPVRLTDEQQPTLFCFQQLRPDYNSLVDISVTTPNKGGPGGTGTGGTASGQQQPGGSGGSDLYSGGRDSSKHWARKQYSSTKNT